MAKSKGEKSSLKRWDELLIDKRFRKPNKTKITTFDHRNPFEKDYSRLVFSPSFRRMQDKTQVFPLNDSDFIRTRLTHSIEVSTIARGLGMNIEGELFSKKLLNPNKIGHIISLLSTACLVHDLGNPPFGHFGETIIQNFFREYLKDVGEHNGFVDQYNRGWTREELADLKYFDGNVQTFRILKRLNYYKDEHSYNLTYPTLASIIKYPFSSIDGNKKTQNKLERKFGYFQSEKDYQEEIWQTLNLRKGTRHPIAFLVEAADDITYFASDIEDGCKKGIITIGLIFEKATEHLDKKSSVDKFLLDILKEHIKELTPQEINKKSDSIVQSFRVYAQGLMINSVVKAFMDNYDAIMGGTYTKNILEDSEAKNIVKMLDEIMHIIHKSREILEMELVGEKVITGLLNMFVNAVNSPNREKTEFLPGKLYELTSKSYRYVFENYKNAKSGISYGNCQLALDYVAGMTDSFALSLYQKISGIEI